MSYNDKLLEIQKKIDKTTELLQTAKTRVSTLETQKEKLELAIKTLQINDYLPIIEALNLSPSELKELLSDYINGDEAETTSESEVLDNE